MTQSNILTMTGHEQKSMTIAGVHLERMTLGDRSLEREVLEIFAPANHADAGADRGCGSRAGGSGSSYPQGVGARNWRLARGAGGRTAGTGRRQTQRGDISAAIAELEAVSQEARLAIGLRLAEQEEDGTASETLSDRSHSHPLIAPDALARRETVR